jgi:hypothetical protein
MHDTIQFNSDRLNTIQYDPQFNPFGFHSVLNEIHVNSIRFRLTSQFTAQLFHSVQCDNYLINNSINYARFQFDPIQLNS